MNIKDWAGVVVALIILVGCAAAPPHHPSRIEVAGSRNLRDLGGYRTMDGKEVSKGFLTGAMNKHTKLAEGDFRNILPRFTPEAMAANEALVDLLKQIAEQKKATPAQIALAWLLAQKPWIVPIPGTTKLHRLEENIGAAAVKLTADDLSEIESAASKITVQGARYPEEIEQMTGR